MSDRGYVGGDIFIVRAGASMFGGGLAADWEIDEVPEQVRSAISPAGLQAWNITDSHPASFTWLAWAGEEELVALAHQDGGIALYEISPKQATLRVLWSSPLAVAEASWPRFSLAPQTGMLALVLEGPSAPREIWAAEHHREHRTIVQVRLAAHRQMELDAGASPGKSFVLYELDCQGLLHSWTVHRRYSEFQDLREELMEMITLYPSARLEPLATLPFPQKKLFGSDSDDTIAERKAGLELWLNGVIEMVPAVASRDAAYTSPAATMVKGFLHVGDGSPISQQDQLIFHPLTAYGHGVGGLSGAAPVPPSPTLGQPPVELPMALGVTEEIRWEGAEGMEMQGILIRPVGAAPPASAFDDKLAAAVGEGGEATSERSVSEFSGSALLGFGGTASAAVGESVEVAPEPEAGDTVDGLLAVDAAVEAVAGGWPLVVCVHGGPTACVQNRYYGADPASSTGRWAQLLASAGCAVFLPNYRGSHGWGLGFAECNHADMGGKDFDDITLGVDHLVSKGLVDKSRVGMCGWSYGGYAAAWVRYLQIASISSSVICT